MNLQNLKTLAIISWQIWLDMVLYITENFLHILVSIHFIFWHVLPDHPHLTNSNVNKQNKKYATMSRVREVHHVDQFGAGDRQFLPRSQTDNSITNHTRPGNYVFSQPQPRSDQPVSYTDSSYSRYQPHHHHYRYMLNRDVETIHNQEKMFSPILKESSVWAIFCRYQYYTLNHRCNDNS